jgi:thymidylate kinase
VNEPLALIQNLVATLNQSGISYCHWKGNYSLDRVLSGEKDFELLVDRRSFNQTLSILLGLQFKRAVVQGEERTPGVSHYYGLDQRTGQLVHVHLYRNLLTGESFIKSHWLPFECMLLENLDTLDGVRVPTRATELISHTLRVFIKYGSLLDLIYLFWERKDTNAEFRWLLDGTDLTETLRILKDYSPLIDESLFTQCIDCFRRPSSLVERMALSRRVRGRLAGFERHSALVRWFKYAQLLRNVAWRRANGNRKNKMFHTGGAVVALVGPEATGKSTLVAECARWLGAAITVRTVHAGKPPSSWLMAPVNLSLPLLRTLLPRLRTTSLEGHRSKVDSNEPNHEFAGLSTVVYSIRAVTLAWDRRRLLLATRRAAADGVVVLCDRYPSETIGTMDSPRLRERVDQRGVIAGICNWLARVEGKLYAQIPAPDLVLKLRVSIETAKVRNRERVKVDKESDTYVESRHRQLASWSRIATKHVCDIDTDQPLSETIKTVKQEVWAVL